MWTSPESSNFGEEAQIRELLGQFKDCVMKTGEDLNMLESKFESDLKKSIKSDLESHMKNMVDLETRLAMEKDAATVAIEKISNAFRNWQSLEDFEAVREHTGNGDGWGDDGEAEDEPPERNPEYDRILNEDQCDLFQETLREMKEARKSRRKQDGRVKQLKQLLSAKPRGRKSNTNSVAGDDNAEEEEEIVASTQDTIPIDPITKKRIMVPVKNKICGHVYDKEGIKVFLQSQNPRCPYIGCMNRAQIRQMDLEDDEEMRQKIEYLMAMEENEETDDEAEDDE